MDNNTFDKDKFRKSQDKIAIFFIIIFFIGLTSVICAFACGNGLFGDLFDDLGLDGEDGYDFYELYALDAQELCDTYYGYNEAEQALYTIKLEYLEDDGYGDEVYYCTVTVDSGMNSESDRQEFKLVSEETAQEFSPNSDYDDCQAIYIYQYSDTAIVVWVTDDGLVLNQNGTRLTKTKIDFAEKMGDPKDYYGTFTFSSTDYVTFNENGKAELTADGYTSEYSYIYVSTEWLSVRSPDVKENSLILFTPGSSKFKYFYYKDNSTLWYGGQESNLFTKGEGGSASLDISDYFGTYYGFDSTEQLFYTLVFKSDVSYANDGKISLTYTNGQVENDNTTLFTKAELLTPSAAQALAGNSTYDDCYAIILRQSSSSAVVLWVTNSGLKLNTKDVVLSKKAMTFADAMDDPMNYYCTYVYNDKNKLTLREDGIASFFFNGTTKTRNYLYVSADWCQQHTTGLTKDAIILYDPDDRNSFIDYYFYYEDKTLLMFSGETAFTGTGSEDKAPSDNDDNDYDDGYGDDSGSSGNEGTSGNNPVSDSVWNSYFKFDNVTIDGVADGGEYTAYIYSPSNADVHMGYYYMEITNDGVYMSEMLIDSDPSSYRYMFWGLLDFSDKKDDFSTSDGGNTFVATDGNGTITIYIKDDKIDKIVIDGSTYMEYDFYHWGETY